MSVQLPANDRERAWAIGAAQALDSIKAYDIRVLDLTGKSNLVDYFVIATGSTPLHMNALADRVAERLRIAKAPKRHVEGRDGDRWILMDYYGVVIHIFSDEGRRYYGLDRLWGDAELVEWEFADTEKKAAFAT